MGKIIKAQLEQVIRNKNKFSLGMKGEFVIEFANDNFGPYEYKFAREDCYYNDGIEDRGTKLFPLRNKQFDNTEIFLETDDIIVCTGERGTLIGADKKFVDIINLKTENKYRLFTDEVNLIYNCENSIIVNANVDGIFKTIELDINSLEVLGEKEETLLAFFKCVYNESDNIWCLLDFQNYTKGNYTNGYFKVVNLDLKKDYKPDSFLRYDYKIISSEGELDIWELSCK